MNKDILNNKEKKEIVDDVRDAISKAKGNFPKNTSKKVLIISIFIILLISIFSIYYFLANNPKTIFIRSVDETFNFLNSFVYEPKYDITKGKIEVNINKATGEFENLTKYSLIDNYKIDSLNKIYSNNLKINYENNNLLEIPLYSENNKTYLYSKDLDKYIEINLINYDSKDIKTMLNSLNTAINNSIDKEKIVGSRLKMNNKNAYKTSLVIDKSNKDLILNNIGESLRGDSRFIKSYKNVFNKENPANEITTIINNLKNKINSLTINIYTEGVTHEFLGIEIINNGTIIINKLNNNKYTYDIKKENTNYKGTIKKNKQTYNINSKIIKNNIQNNINFKIKVKESSVDKFEKKEIQSIKTDELSEEDKNIINSKFTSDNYLSNYKVV